MFRFRCVHGKETIREIEAIQYNTCSSFTNGNSIIWLQGPKLNLISSWGCLTIIHEEERSVVSRAYLFYTLVESGLRDHEINHILILRCEWIASNLP